MPCGRRTQHTNTNKLTRNTQAIIQLIACSVANRTMAYFTFGDTELADKLKALDTAAQKNETSIGDLYVRMSRTAFCLMRIAFQSPQHGASTRGLNTRPQHEASVCTCICAICIVAPRFSITPTRGLNTRPRCARASVSLLLALLLSVKTSIRFRRFTPYVLYGKKLF